jgi:peptidyl-tRNA hydrolase
MKAIVGLGNPGPRFVKTRHNVGFRVVDAIADCCGGVWHESGDVAHTQVVWGTQSFVLVKPLTFMNNSGQAIPFLLKKGIKPDEILVIHDELEKPFGKLMLKFGGSSRGHNGLRSLESVIGSDFWRLRFGIGRPASKDQVSDYVLTQFTPAEEALMEGLIHQALLLINPQ